MPIVVGCQWCKDLMSWGLAQGMAWTIGLLLLVPLLCIGVITILLVRSARRADKGRP
ncbi:MAG: hypothetical protein HY600_06585 [Candidatus Omnitrophica bacterium]|nr:hypothetical protein [Candidatus Omnitrophota bacterium]